MKEWFLARIYPDNQTDKVVNNQADKAVVGRDQSVKKNIESDILFVTTYHPKFKELEKLVRDLFTFLYNVCHLLRSYLTEMLEKQKVKYWYLSCILLKKR